MLDADDLVDATVAALQNTAGVTAIVPSGNIAGFKFLYGTEQTLELAVGTLKAPSILVSWDRTDGGRGMTMWSHTLKVWMRLGNTATIVDPPSYAKLWAAIWGGLKNLEIIAGKTQICDLPSTTHMVDSEGVDYFCGTFVFPEIGDN